LDLDTIAWGHGLVLPTTYDPYLVALSVVVASIAAYTALTLAERVTVAQGRLRLLWLLGGATAMGSGIWSMHFTGMLAFSLPIPISYDVPLVVLSLLAAIAASGVALSIVTRRNLSLRPWLLGSLLMGVGVGIMHYTGMAAMHMDAMAHWDYRIVGLSVLIAIVVSLVALFLVVHLRTATKQRVEWRRLAAAGVMGLAIAGMHYTGMAAATFTDMAMPPSGGYVVSAAALGGGAIALITVLVLGLALGVAFVDRRFAAQEQALAESKHHVRMVVANAPVILFALDAAGVITLAQGRGLTALGHTPDAVMGRSFFDLYDDVPELMQQGQCALAGEEHTALSTVRDVVLETRWTPVHDERGHVTGVIAVSTDITERRRAEVALQHQALHDVLTDLPNRTLLGEQLTHNLGTAHETGGTLALVFMDLNRFKDVNDTLGHHVGDALLLQVGARVQGILRTSDLVARLGGDEFAVLLPGAAAPVAVALAQRILAVLTAPIVVEGRSLEIGASLGIAVYPEHGTDAGALMRHADVAMYVAKRAGSGYALYDPAHDQHNPTRLTMESDLRQAIAAGDLQLYYQPKVDLTTNQLCGVEALARWPHPAHGLIPPDQFIPLAEQTGLIAPLTQWVLEAALRQLHTWAQDGLRLGVAVNLSTHILHDPTLPDTVAWLLQRYAVAPERLTLEVTESTLMADPTQAKTVLLRLAALGVSLSIDDFGTGYSSLGYLIELPVSEVKIDKSFVLRLDGNEKNAAIVRSVSDLGRHLGLQVVAEGVETAAAWHGVRTLGCAVAQGYYLSRPLPATELARWIQGSRWAVA
jgi:diguanylate cyclase